MAFLPPPPLSRLAPTRPLAPGLVRRRPRHHFWQPPVAKARCKPANPRNTPNPVEPSTAATPTPPPRTPQPRHWPLRGILLTLVLSLLFFLPRPPLTALTALTTSLSPLRAASLIGLTNYFTVLLCFPANMAFMIAAGALLGPLPAFVALFSSKLLAAATAFVLARRVFTARVQRLLRRRPRLAGVLRGSDTGWRFVFLMRLSPFPGFMLNYLLSVTDVGFWDYFVGTVLGTFPSVFNLVLVGDAARGVGMGIGGVGSRGWLSTGLRFACAMSMVLVTVLVVRKVKKVFSEFDDDIAEVKA